MLVDFGDHSIVPLRFKWSLEGSWLLDLACRLVNDVLEISCLLFFDDSLIYNGLFLVAVVITPPCEVLHLKLPNAFLTIIADVLSAVRITSKNRLQLFLFGSGCLARPRVHIS